MKRLIMTTLCLLAACSHEALPPLVASEVEITTPPPGMTMRAGYLTLTNNTGAPITITAVSSPEFAKVEIHETRIEDGIASMHRLHELVVPAGSSVRLERGGKHLMLMQPRDPVEAVSLQFMSGDSPMLDVHYRFETRH